MNANIAYGIAAAGFALGCGIASLTVEKVSPAAAFLGIFAAYCVVSIKEMKK